MHIPKDGEFVGDIHYGSPQYIKDRGRGGGSATYPQQVWGTLGVPLYRVRQFCRYSSEPETKWQDIPDSSNGVIAYACKRPANK